MSWSHSWFLSPGPKVPGHSLATRSAQIFNQAEARSLEMEQTPSPPSLLTSIVQHLGHCDAKGASRRCKMWLGKSQRCMLLGHGCDREHPCGNSVSHIPSLTTLNGWVLFAFFFSCCENDVAGTALHMRNGQLMNSANHSNHTSWMLSVVLDHSHSKTLIRKCCYHALPPFLFIPLVPAPLSSSLTKCMMESVWKMKSQPGRAVPAPAWWNTPHHPCKRTWR